ncbi:Two component system response regulator [Desulfonema limicola]|uniref:Two component system response regulator n=1 Tax=Desulfonema limicola TaxID=45656 RepID=A0A975B4P6_9BACT|nr:sigma-54 dependent transcriptional regulator [Desulfonema limicola]QTA78752.1 Two component system response regulator [Desulfonema limicola]
MENKRILFVDDQLDVWENALKEDLGGFGFELKGIENPRDTCRFISSYSPDIVLLDILFPEGNKGKSTLEAIKKQFPDIPVIMFTDTMCQADYNSLDYELADYRYSKDALRQGYFSDLANIMKNLIEKSKKNLKILTDGWNPDFGFIIGNSKAMLEIAKTIQKMADTDSTILITGETGTGKGVIAESIHKLSNRNGNSFETFVCAERSKDLIEDDLFGHEKNAFNQADFRTGILERADKGTLFLDEISEIPLPIQTKLLRFIENRTFERLGGKKTLHTDVRIIAATNKEMLPLIEDGEFRNDLFYRLNVINVSVPPLRKRIEDIPLFYKHFVSLYCKEIKRTILPEMHPEVEKLLTSYHWPGNIRELKHAIENAVYLSEDTILQVNHFSNINNNDNSTAIVQETFNIAKEICDGNLTWDSISKELGNSGRKAVLKDIEELLTKKFHRKPSRAEEAECLRLSPENTRQLYYKHGLVKKRKKKNS